MTKTETKPPYYYDGSLLLAEKDSSGQLQKVYVNDGSGLLGIVRPIYDGATLKHYQRLYYLYDSLGSVSEVTGENGLHLIGYTYSPYGYCMNVTGDPINNLQFIGRYGGYLDSDSGLTYFWHRWYDAKDGRWVSRDKIKESGILLKILKSVNNIGIVDFNFSKLDESENYYKYTKNNSINYHDRSGLSSLTYNSDIGMISIYDKDGNLVGNDVAGNNTTNPGGNPIQPGSNGPAPFGVWPVGQIIIMPTYDPNSSIGMGFLPIICPRPGEGVHAGRTNRGGPLYCTYGCIRTSDDFILLIEFMDAIGDPVDSISIY